jgi:hypothetical protein
MMELPINNMPADPDQAQKPGCPATELNRSNTVKDSSNPQPEDTAAIRHRPYPTAIILTHIEGLASQAADKTQASTSFGSKAIMARHPNLKASAPEYTVSLK